MPHDWMTATLAPGVRRYPDMSDRAGARRSRRRGLSGFSPIPSPPYCRQRGSSGTHSLDLVFASAEPIFEYTDNPATGNRPGGERRTIFGPKLSRRATLGREETRSVDGWQRLNKGAATQLAIDLYREAVSSLSPGFAQRTLGYATQSTLPRNGSILAETYPKTLMQSLRDKMGTRRLPRVRCTNPGLRD